MFVWMPTCPSVFVSLWREIDDGICAAPHSYEGSCVGYIATARMTDQDKTAFGLECGARWPCSQSPPAECVRNYSAACPFGWFETMKGDAVECRAPITSGFCVLWRVMSVSSIYWRYSKCKPVQQFTDFTPFEKQMWEASCEVRFPCSARGANWSQRV